MFRAPTQRGAPQLAPLIMSSRSLLTAYRSLLGSNQLGQPALLPGRSVLMDNALLGGAVQKLHRLGIGGSGLGPGGSTHFPERRAELAAVGAVVDGTGTALAHTLGSGFDTGHGNLVTEKFCSGIAPEAEPEKIGHRGRKVKRDAVLTLPLSHV